MNYILQNAFEKMKIMARVGTARHGEDKVGVVERAGTRIVHS